MKLKKGLALFLCAGMVLSLAACNDESNNTTEENKEVIATVQYAKDGSLTAVLNGSESDFKKIKTDDVSVSRIQLNEEKYNTLKETVQTSDSESVSESDADVYDTKTLAVSDVSVSGENMNIVFTDEDISADRPDTYTIKYGDSEVTAGVEYPGDILNVDVDSVYSNDKEIKLTMALNIGEFADGITAGALELDGSFCNMSIDSVSSSGKNLTVQLTGSLCKIANSYSDGVLRVSQDCIPDSRGDAQISVSVIDNTIVVNAEKFAYKDGKATLPIELVGYTFTDGVDANDVTIGDYTIDSLTRDSDTTATLTISGIEADDDMAAAEALAQQTITLSANAVKEGEISYPVAINTAGFYPVFDYVSEADGSLQYTLMLYANAGTFAEKLSKDMISFGEDFDGASVVSLDHESDTTAKLVLSVPAGDTTADEASLSGDVILAAGTLINEWGTKAKECSYSRTYDSESMGRISLVNTYDVAGNLTSGDIQIIQNIVGGLGNTTIGSISSAFSIGTSIYSGVSTLLDVTGVVPSFETQVLNKLNEISSKLDNLQYSMDNLTSELRAFRDAQLTSNAKESVNNFTTVWSALADQNEKIAEIINTVATERADDINAISPRPSQSLAYDTTNFACTSSDELQRQWSDYYKAVITVALTDNSNGYNYKDDFDSLQTKWDAFIAKFNNRNVVNAFESYDEYCSLIYNFESSAIAAENVFRLNVAKDMASSMQFLQAYYVAQGKTGSQSALSKKYQEASAMITYVTPRTDGKVYCYSLGRTYLENAVKIDASSIDENEYGGINYVKVDNKNYNTEKKITNDQMTSFLNRMNGRSALQELNFAGFITDDKYTELNNASSTKTTYMIPGDFSGEDNMYPTIQDPNNWNLTVAGLFNPSSKISELFSLVHQNTYAAVFKYGSCGKWTSSDVEGKGKGLINAFNFDADDSTDHYFALILSPDVCERFVSNSEAYILVSANEYK